MTESDHSARGDREMKFKLSNLASMLGAPSASHQQEPATVLFADISGSTRLFEKYGDVRARQIESRVLDLLAERTVAHQGVVVKTIGDEIMSRFPEAILGVKSACDMQQAIKHDSHRPGYPSGLTCPYREQRWSR